MAGLFTDKQLALPAQTDVAACVIAVQVIDRAFERGRITGMEAKFVAARRDSLLEAVRAATGIHYDEARLRAAAPVEPKEDAGNE